MTDRLPIVGVIGSGTRAHASLSEPVGLALAGMGVHLLTGGGGGVMAAASRAFAQAPSRDGLVLGILPASPDGAPTPTPPPGYPNPWVEVPIRTHLDQRGQEGGGGRSRNHLIALTAGALIALPGGAGTASEVALARTYGTPLYPVRNPGDLAGLGPWVARVLGLD